MKDANGLVARDADWLAVSGLAAGACTAARAQAAPQAGAHGSGGPGVGCQGPQLR